MRKRSERSGPRVNRHADSGNKMQAYGEEFLDELLIDQKRPVFLLILDQIQDPHNLGACLRSADGAGVDAVIVTKDRSAALTDTVRMIACGAAESVPVVMVTNLARTMEFLKSAGVWLVGTSDQAEKSIYDTDLTGPLAIVMGSEGKGMRRLTTENCDFLVSLPMAGKVESLNVSVATGVTLYEAVRQRTSK